RIIENQRVKHPIEDVAPVVSPAEVLEEMRKLRELPVEQNVADYIVRLVAATREHRDVARGASARASLSLYRVCQAMAWIMDRKFVTPDMVKRMAPPVIAHRLILRPQARLGGVSAEQILKDVIDRVEVPVVRMTGSMEEA